MIEKICVEIILFLRVLFTPATWIRNHATSPALDRFIRQKLAEGHAPQRVDAYHAELAGKKFWTANRLYASPEYNSCLPSRRTAILFFDAYETAEFSEL